MYPMITSLSEIAQIKEIVEEVKAELDADGSSVWYTGAGYYDRDTSSSNYQ